MSFFKKMERKFGRYAIRNLMYYIMMLYAMGMVIGFINPMFYYEYLALNAQAILHGQIWRLVTFLICPPAGGGGDLWGILWNVIAIYLYYSLGTTLERVWGVFRFNVYFFMGILGHILAEFIIYWMTGISYPLSTYYLNNSLFLAFAVTFPQMRFYLMGILPITAKILGFVIGFEFLFDFVKGGVATKVAILLSLLNFALFLVLTRNYKVINPRELKRKQEFKSQIKKAEVQKIILTHHTCAVCGRTEKDDPNLEFRYCSKCAGNLEYCMDHLYTHRHVTEDELKQTGAGK